MQGSIENVCLASRHVVTHHDTNRAREQKQWTPLPSACGRSRHHTRHFHPDAIDVVAGSDVKALAVWIAERDVGRADLTFRFPADNRQIEIAEERSSR